MTSELDPFGWHVVLAFIGSVGLFYLIGAAFVSVIEESVLSIGLRIAFGALFTISAFAVVAAGYNTGMIFHLLLFVWMFWNNKTLSDYSDILQLRTAEIAWLLLFGLMIFLLEAVRSDLRIADGLYVGNEDASFYASFGHSMFLTGIEANPENVSPVQNGTIYHFGDLWFSGIYSNVFSILPYYSYMILYRSVTVFALSVMIIGWVSRNVHKLFLGGVTILMVLGATYLELVPVRLPDLDLFDLFPCYYPIYGTGPYLIVGMSAVAFCILTVEKNWVLGTIGLLFVALLHGGLVIASAIAGGIILCGFLIHAIYYRRPIYTVLKKVGPLFVAGTIPFVYYAVDNRFESSGINLFSFQYVYLVVHTFIRVCISQLFVIPYLLGLLFFWIKNEKGKKLVLVQLSYFTATLLSMAIIFPLVQGNSGQIPSIHFTGILAPVCIVGLMGLLFDFNLPKIRIFAGIILVVIAFQTTRIALLSNYYLVTYDWKFLTPGYKEKSTFPESEWEKMRALLKDGETTRFGYFICDTSAGGGVHYNEFTFLKSVLPGAVFHRMNSLPKDTIQSAEMLAYYYRTSLGYFAQRNEFDFEKVEEDHMNYLKPDYLLLPKSKRKYCVPEKWKRNSEAVLETTNYLFYDH